MLFCPDKKAFAVEMKASSVGKRVMQQRRLACTSKPGQDG